MLLERLGKNLGELGLSVANVLEAISATLQSFWRPLSGDAGLRTGAEHARWLSRYIADTDQALGGLCERAVIDRALELCDRRAASFDASRAVLVHGDAHGWNTLDAGDGTYKFVDVEGLCSEREHDLGVAMREYNAPLLQGDTRSLVRERAELLADRCAVDARKVWEWGFIERVSTGLANLRDFADDDGAMFLEVAARSI
jgi:streptomycin 6-kinase